MPQIGSDWVICKECGKKYQNYNSSRHKKSKMHKMGVHFKEELTNMIIDLNLKK
jgi:hypothetical protein